MTFVRIKTARRKPSDATRNSCGPEEEAVWVSVPLMGYSWFVRMTKNIVDKIEDLSGERIGYAKPYVGVGGHAGKIMFELVSSEKADGKSIKISKSQGGVKTDNSRLKLAISKDVICGNMLIIPSTRCSFTTDGNLLTLDLPEGMPELTPY